VAALATLALRSRAGSDGIACRLLTGAALAGVYPPGMKIAAGWFREGRGLAIGILVGALTIGSASPHLVRWPFAGGVARRSRRRGAQRARGVSSSFLFERWSYAAPSPPFSLAAAPRILRDRAVALAKPRYLGHMWEVYAMWTWMAVFITASEHARRGADADVTGLAALVTFAVVGSGAIGCWLGGRYADRWGRTW